MAAIIASPLDYTRASPEAAPASVPRPVRAGVSTLSAHHGEIVQGVFPDDAGRLEHGLVTLPCRVFGTLVRFQPGQFEPLTVAPPDRKRSLTAARLTLDALGCSEYGGVLHIESGVPVGWGCGSSTADVVATIRAVADAFAVALEPELIAMLSVTAEVASDSLMFAADRVVLFAQRRGRVLRDLGGPLPPVTILGVNTEIDRGVGTLSLPRCDYAPSEIEAFGVILQMVQGAVERQDAWLLGQAATASAMISQRHRPKRFMGNLLGIASATGALGVQVAHSGTVAGLLFDRNAHLPDRMDDARARLRRIGLERAWEFSTDGHTRAGSES